MKYELYLDSFFFLNFSLDLLLLLLVKCVLRRTATHLRLFLGAAGGAAAICLLTLIPFVPGAVKLFAGFGLVGACMVSYSFRLKDLRMILKGTLSLYGFAFFMGGFLEVIMRNLPFAPEGKIPMGGMVAGAYGLYVGFSNLYHRWQGRRNLVLVKLLGEGWEKEVTALVDTGNSLTEPLTGRPVSLVEKGLLEDVIGLRRPQDFCVIPYHSVGKEKGVLEGMTIKAMSIEDGEELILVKRPVLALYEGAFTGGHERYRMILHPQCRKE